MTKPVTLRIAAVRTPQWLDSRDLYYQLLYGNRDTLSAYSESRWLAPPARMLESLLVDGLARAGAWKAVIGPETDALADYAVQLHLFQFQQVFEGPKESNGVLVAQISVIDARRDSVVAQHTFRFEVAAPSPDALGGVRALRKASRELIVSLDDWLEKVLLPRNGAAPPGGRGR